MIKMNQHQYLPPHLYHPPPQHQQHQQHQQRQPYFHDALDGSTRSAASAQTAPHRNSRPGMLNRQHSDSFLFATPTTPRQRRKGRVVVLLDRDRASLPQQRSNLHNNSYHRGNDATRIEPGYGTAMGTRRGESPFKPVSMSPMWNHTDDDDDDADIVSDDDRDEDVKLPMFRGVPRREATEGHVTKEHHNELPLVLKNSKTFVTGTSTTTTITTTPTTQTTMTTTRTTSFVDNKQQQQQLSPSSMSSSAQSSLVDQEIVGMMKIVQDDDSDFTDEDGDDNHDGIYPEQQQEESAVDRLCRDLQLLAPTGRAAPTPEHPRNVYPVRECYYFTPIDGQDGVHADQRLSSSSLSRHGLSPGDDTIHSATSSSSSSFLVQQQQQ